MSAVPQKKLCWNCDGNVSRDLDSCPYCGVCVHSIDLEGNNWNAPYNSNVNEEELEIPRPLYKIHESKSEETTKIFDQTESFEESESIWVQVKKDVLPILLLMSGSIFFLFGIVLLLFSENGTLILQWNGNNWPYFLLAAIPCAFLGWRYLSTLENDDI